MPSVPDGAAESLAADPTDNPFAALLELAHRVQRFEWRSLVEPRWREPLEEFNPDTGERVPSPVMRGRPVFPRDRGSAAEVRRHRCEVSADLARLERACKVAGERLGWRPEEVSEPIKALHGAVTAVTGREGDTGGFEPMSRAEFEGWTEGGRPVAEEHLSVLAEELLRA